MSVFEQNEGGEDQEQFSQAIIELERTFEEPIIIRRWLSQSATPNEFKQAPPPVYSDTPSTAVMVSLGLSKALLAAGVLSAGDVHLQIRERLSESNETIGGSQAGDHVIFRGSEYRLIQRPEPAYLGDVLFYNTYLRRTNSTTDTVGL